MVEDIGLMGIKMGLKVLIGMLIIGGLMVM